MSNGPGIVGRRSVSPHRAGQIARGVLCATAFFLAGGGRLCAESLVVSNGVTAYLSGSHTYDTVDIQGTLLLQGDTEIIVNARPTNGSPTTVFVFNGTIGCDLADGTVGVNGANGSTVGGDGSDAAAPGAGGANGYDLTLIIHGDVVCGPARPGTINLEGRKGGSGGMGGWGASGPFYDVDQYGPGGNGGEGSDGGQGGRGGNLRLVCDGVIQANGSLHVLCNGGEGGRGGLGGCSGCCCSGLSGKAGDGARGGNGGSIDILAQSVPWLYLSAKGGNGGAGGQYGAGINLNYAGPGPASDHAGNGGNGGSIRVRTACDVTGFSAKATGGDGGMGGTGTDEETLDNNGAQCNENLWHDGFDGGCGGNGGNGGSVDAESRVLGNVYVELGGGAGGQGGMGGMGLNKWFYCAQTGDGGNGGNGGAGGRLKLKASLIELAQMVPDIDGDGAPDCWLYLPFPCPSPTNLTGGAAGYFGYSPSSPYCPATGAEGQPGVRGTDGGMSMEVVPPNAKPEVELLASRGSVAAGEMLTYTAVVRTQQAQPALTVEVGLPAGCWFVGAEENGQPTSTNISWSLPYLTECDIETFSVRVQVDYGAGVGTVITNQATVRVRDGLRVESGKVRTTVTAAPAGLLGGGADVPYVSDPVHPGLGNFTTAQHLFHLPGRGLPLSFDLTYNSLAADASASNAVGVLGYGWTHSLGVRLELTNQVSQRAAGAELRAATNLEARLWWGNGRCDAYYQDSSGGFQAFGGHPRVSLNKMAEGYEAVEPGGVRHVFNGDGVLTRSVDLSSNATAFAYGSSGVSSGRLSRVTDAAGRILTFGYNDNRLLAVVTLAAPINLSATFAYDANSNLTTFTDLRGYTHRFAYDQRHLLLSETDARAIRTVENVYDETGRVVLQRNALGQASTFGYATNDPSGWLRVNITGPGGVAASHYYDWAFNIRKITDTAGRTSQFAYDSAGNRLSVTDKKGQGGSFRYDGSHNPTSLTDRAGVRMNVQYGAFRRPTRIEDALGQASTFAYDASSRLRSARDALGNVVTLGYGASSLPTTMTDPSSNTWSMAYDGQGLMSGFTDPAGNAVACTYDNMGRLASATLPGGGVSLQMVYDAEGNMTRFTDLLGNQTTRAFDPENNLTSVTFDATAATTTYDYNPLGQVTNVTDAMGGQIRYAYDAAGRLASVTDPDGVTASMSYDARGQLTAVTDPLGQTTHYAYDENGNLVTVTDHQGKTWRYAYDAENRVTEVSDPLGGRQAFARDALGRVTAVTDEAGRTTRQAYDAAGRVIRVTAPDGGVTLTEYDARSNVRTITDPLGHAWTFEYDAPGRVTKKTDPAGQMERYQYDARGQVTQKTTRDGKVFGFAYDLNGRLTAVALPGGGGVISNTYDAAGNLTAQADGVLTNRMTYDVLNRRTTFTDGYGQTMRYAYTVGGRLAALTYPGDRTVTNTYDTAGRLASARDWTGRQITYAYDTLNRVSAMTLPNGTRRLYAYDDNGRVHTLRHETSGGVLIESYQYRYNAAGQLTGRTRDTAGVVGTVGSATNAWSVDVMNRVLAQVAGNVTNRFTYDARGNLVSRMGSETNTFAYDTLDRLVATTSGAMVVRYTYDPAGNRVAKMVNGTTTRYLNDGGRVYAQLDGSGNALAYYVYAGPLAYRVDVSSKVAVYHADERGSVVGITDENEALLQSYAYAPYGKVTASAGALTNEFRYVGAYGVMTDENGLYHMQARYYDPDLGAFLTEDPLGLAAGLNLYGYVAGDPVNQIDPSGLAPLPTPIQTPAIFLDKYWEKMSPQVVEIKETSQTVGVAPATDMIKKGSQYKKLKSLSCGFDTEAMESYGLYCEEAWDAIEKGNLAAKETAKDMVGKSFDIVDSVKGGNLSAYEEELQGIAKLKNYALKNTKVMGFVKVGGKVCVVLSLGLGVVYLSEAAHASSPEDATRLAIEGVDCINPMGYISSGTRWVVGTFAPKIPGYQFATFDEGVVYMFEQAGVGFEDSSGLVNKQTYYETKARQDRDKWKSQFDFSDCLNQKAK